jgi:hypothetical protein
MPGGELMERTPAVGGVDEKLGSFHPDLRDVQFRRHDALNNCPFVKISLAA